MTYTLEIEMNAVLMYHLLGINLHISAKNSEKEIETMLCGG